MEIVLNEVRGIIAGSNISVEGLENLMEKLQQLRYTFAASFSDVGLFYLWTGFLIIIITIIIIIDTVCRQQAYYAPISHARLSPRNPYVPNYMDHYSFTDPREMDG